MRIKFKFPFPRAYGNRRKQKENALAAARRYRELGDEKSAKRMDDIAASISNEIAVHGDISYEDKSMRGRRGRER